YVADTRPDAAAVNARKKPAVARADAPGDRAAEAPKPPKRGLSDLSTRGRRLIDQAGVSAKQWGAFMPGVPDVAEFPA
ncbi:PLP-dependent aminotransferase family protein, partial [Burkholderia sp. SIMBA_042]